MKERSHPFLALYLLVTVSINSDLPGDVDQSVFFLFVEVGFRWYIMACRGSSLCFLHAVNSRVNSRMINGTIVMS